MNENATLVASLARSDLYRSFSTAYNEATGLPLAIRPVECWQVPMHGQRKESAFCALMATRSGTCAACLQAQERLTKAAMERPATNVCQRGLSEGAAPIRLGEKTIGFLQTGQVRRNKPTEEQFQRVLTQVRAAGLETPEAELRSSYFQVPVMPPRQLESAVQLLDIFARHLALKLNEMMLQAASTEPPLVVRARQYIREHLTEPLTLDAVAKAIHTSKFNLCKVFKKATGQTFTEYVARLRTEEAKTRLADRQRRVSEVAYDVGFQSLTHFNRVFRELVGLSPSGYREQCGRA